MSDPTALFGFGPQGWGRPLLWAALMTISVSAAAFALGLVFGLFGAWGKLSGSRAARGVSGTYTTILRGVPDLLVVYVFYFGGSQALSWFGHLFGAQGFIGLPGFAVGAIAIGIVRVEPAKLPAKVIVAPNSPSARAQHRTVPASSEGRTSGSVTVQNVRKRDAPSVAAASS